MAFAILTDYHKKKIKETWRKQVFNVDYCRNGFLTQKIFLFQPVNEFFLQNTDKQYPASFYYAPLAAKLLDNG
ncbi:MAG: hypothetical protein ABF651_03350 [Sporolactobacillus sp.]